MVGPQGRFVSQCSRAVTGNVGHIVDLAAGDGGNSWHPIWLRSRAVASQISLPASSSSGDKLCLKPSASPRIDAYASRGHGRFTTKATTLPHSANPGTSFIHNRRHNAWQWQSTGTGTNGAERRAAIHHVTASFCLPERICQSDGAHRQRFCSTASRSRISWIADSGQQT